MPQVGIRYGQDKLTWDEALERSQDPSFPYPPPLIRAMAEQRIDRTPSASSIGNCLRQFELKRRVDYYEDANGQLPPLFGTAFHSLMEQYEEHLPGDLTEQRWETEIDGYDGYPVSFSGRGDFIRPGVLIRDWKTKRNIPVGFAPPEGHIIQANIYNWLAYMNGIEPATEVELAYVSQSWAHRHREAAKPVALVGNYVRKRLHQWGVAAANGTLPAPVPELFQPDGKGKLPAPCGYCPVREHCLADLKQHTARPFPAPE